VCRHGNSGQVFLDSAGLCVGVVHSITVPVGCTRISFKLRIKPATKRDGWADLVRDVWQQYFGA
jgi:hypothetical protein